MLSFSRMVLGASTLASIFLETTISSKTFVTAIILQAWLLLEWIALKTNQKIPYDVVLHDVLPFLAQLIVFYKTIMLN